MDRFDKLKRDREKRVSKMSREQLEKTILRLYDLSDKDKEKLRKESWRVSNLKKILEENEINYIVKYRTMNRKSFN